MVFRWLLALWRSLSTRAKAGWLAVAGAVWHRAQEWFWKAVEWVLDKAFGDAVFASLKAGLSAVLDPAWLSALWGWGPTMLLGGAGVYLLLTGDGAPAPLRRARAFVATHARARLWVRMAGVAAILFAVYGAASLATRPETAPPPAPPPAQVPEPTPGRPPGDTPVQRAFLNDFNNSMRAYMPFEFKEAEGSRMTVASVQRVLVFEGNVDFLAVYLPHTPLAFSTLVHIAENWNDLLKDFRFFMVTQQTHGDINRFGGKDMKFAGVIHFYTEDFLSIEEMADLRRVLREKGVGVFFKHPGTLQPARDGFSGTPNPAASPSLRSRP